MLETFNRDMTLEIVVECSGSTQWLRQNAALRQDLVSELTPLVEDRYR